MNNTLESLLAEARKTLTNVPANNNLAFAYEIEQKIIDQLFSEAGEYAYFFSPDGLIDLYDHDTNIELEYDEKKYGKWFDLIPKEEDIKKVNCGFALKKEYGKRIIAAAVNVNNLQNNLPIFWDTFIDLLKSNSWIECSINFAKELISRDKLIPVNDPHLLYARPSMKSQYVFTKDGKDYIILGKLKKFKV
jgi:hypothetical protein